ncbi:folliculin-interacting protein 2-like isoform X2 [Liolophura sinensis]|uniref:folliculin-interacting protein 2-like isoform X2 n=1 Tax=Liolophura sinensis TaxID=3198878 RepID=UPI0031588C83
MAISNMALIRLFQGRKTFRNNGNKWNPNDTNSKWKCPKLERNKIRLIIFGDNDRRGRQLLFDSNSIKKIDDTTSGDHGKCQASRLILRARTQGCAKPGKGESEPTKPGAKYQYSRPGSDVKMLEEMMFGSVAMSFKGSAMKVHFIKAPAQLMLTKVFIPDKPKTDSAGDQESFDTCSLASSTGDISAPKHISGLDKPGIHVAQSVPMDVPSPTYLDWMDEDSGLASASMTSSGSFQTSLPSPSNNSSGYSSSSFNSLHRRWMRNQSTSLETYCRKRPSTTELLNSTEVSPAEKQSKLGVGIMFDLFDDKDQESTELFQNFFFSHITLFEGHVEKLKAAIGRGYYNRRNFVHIIMEALAVFRKDIYDLYTAPRLSEPVWLNMMAYSNYRYVLCEQFMKELMTVVAKFDNKNTNFFVSTLVTAVLTHHLAWVPTVTPAGGTPSKTYLDKHSAKWLDTLAKSHPYNPLWAQLGDLYGAIGFPLRIARTVVVGKKADLVNKFLYVLSYFIRCSEVHESGSNGLLTGSLEDLVLEETPSEADKVTLGAITPIEELEGHGSVRFFGGDWGSLVSSEGSVVSNLGRQVSREADIKRTDFCQCQTSQKNFPNLNPAAEKKGLEMEKILSEKADENQNSYESCEEQAAACPSSVTNDTARPRLTRVALSKDCGNAEKTLDINGEDQICKMFNVVVEERSKLDVRHVRSEAEAFSSHVIPTDLDCGKSGPVICDKGRELLSDTLSISTPTKGRSALSEQLAEEAPSKQEPPLNSSNAEIQCRNRAKAQFLKEGSNSMFDEYFEDGSETKTIDDIRKEDIVTTNPLFSRLSSSSIGRLEDDKGISSGQVSQEGENKAVEKTCECEDTQNEKCPATNRPPLSRQGSSVSEKPPAIRPTSLAPGRCRSVTPTELGRRRHLSSTSSFDMDMQDPLLNCKEIPLLRQNSETLSVKIIKAFERNFGRSLMAGFSDHYLSDFVLHGTSDNNFHHKLLADLNLAIQHPVLDEPVTEAVCVIADTDTWTVEVMSSHASTDRLTDKWVASQLVCNLLEAVHDLWKLKMSPEFCLMHLEDRLQEIFFKSRTLMEYLRGIQMSKTKCNKKDLAALLGLDSNNSSDLQLLLSIAGTHSPMVPGPGM